MYVLLCLFEEEKKKEKKRGKGRFSDRMTQELFGELLGRTPASIGSSPPGPRHEKCGEISRAAGPG